MNGDPRANRAYGQVVTRRLRALGIRDRPTSPRSPWQNAYVDRLGSECVDYVVVLGERHLRHQLLSYKTYYNETRTHLSLNKDAPSRRAVQATGLTFCQPILGGHIISMAEFDLRQAQVIIGEPVLGGLHHVYHLAA